MWDLRKTFLFLFPNALLSFLGQTAGCAAFSQNDFNVFTAAVTTVITTSFIDCFYAFQVLWTF